MVVIFKFVVCQRCNGQSFEVVQPNSKWLVVVVAVQERGEVKRERVGGGASGHSQATKKSILKELKSWVNDRLRFHGVYRGCCGQRGLK